LPGPVDPAFLAAALVLELIPGPNMAWVALTSAIQGHRAGLAAVAGVALGLSLLALVALFGLDRLLAEVPALAPVLNFAGMIVMFYLAWEAWRDGGKLPETPSGAPTRARTGALAQFQRGLLLNITNVKTGLVFVTLLPGFIHPGAGSRLTQLATLSAAYVLVATLVHLAIVALAGRLHGWLREPGRVSAIQRGFAVLLLGIGLWMGLRG
jgi:threonine/homoserine/homoserine lactone efflux protein